MDHGHDKGLIRLINQKLDSGHTIKEIRELLYSAGIAKNSIERALLHTHKRSAYSQNINYQHRQIEGNDYLPPLAKPHNGHTDLYGSTAIFEQEPLHRTKKHEDPIETRIEKVISSEIRHRGLFVGRLRRKDFIIGILFFFGLGFIFFTSGIYLLQLMSPEVWQNIVTVVENDNSHVWRIFLPLIFAPITIMFMSLLTRRLHNLELPGFIAWFYLIILITPPQGIAGQILLTIDIALFVLFILLISKKGHPAPNKHGSLPPNHGSMFAKIFGYEHA